MKYPTNTPELCTCYESCHRPFIIQRFFLITDDDNSINNNKVITLHYQKDGDQREIKIERMYDDCIIVRILKLVTIGERAFSRYHFLFSDIQNTIVSFDTRSELDRRLYRRVFWVTYTQNQGTWTRQ